MNKLLCMAFALVGILAISSSTSLAHPPGKAQVSHNKKDGILVVSIPHSVKDPNSHYVEHVMATKNGKTVIDAKFNKQSSKGRQDMMGLEFPVKPGDKIVVKAKCNVAGDSVLEYTVR